jgi:TBC1 domain family protein 5
VQWVIDPYKMAMDSTDLAKNNPLAVDDDAPWQRHFQDEQFRKQIQQDVHRTFPALDYFRRKDVQEDLLNILFCYARSNPSLAYRQGMHELLAGMYYTVACDAGVVDPNGTLAEGDEATTSKKSGSNGNSGESINAQGDEARIRSLMKVVVDRDHIPHDAHTLFCVAMETAGGWFAQTQEEVQLQRRKALENHTPFASPSQVDSGAKSIVMVRLDRIHEKLLKTFDSELYHRLQVCVCVCVCVCVRACVCVCVRARVLCTVARNFGVKVTILLTFE